MRVPWKILCSEFLLLASARLGLSQGQQLAASPSPMTLMTSVGQGIVSQLTVVSTGSAIPFTASASSNGNWLGFIIGDRYTNTGTTPTTLAVTVFQQANMSVGTYSGTITLTSKQATNSPLIVPVTLTLVKATLVVSPANLTFNAAVGETTTLSQSIALTSTTSPVELFFGAAVATGATWLSVSPSTGSTPAHLTVNVNPTGLGAGTYNGTISILPQNGTATVVPVILTIGKPVLTASPPQLNFAYQIGGPIPNPQSLHLNYAQK
jgi:hypothetical protein